MTWRQRIFIAMGVACAVLSIVKASIMAADGSDGVGATLIAGMLGVAIAFWLMGDE
jgi:hypothetical protein